MIDSDSKKKNTQFLLCAGAGFKYEKQHTISDGHVNLNWLQNVQYLCYTRQLNENKLRNT